MSVPPLKIPPPPPRLQPDGFDLEERLAEAAVFAKYGLIEKAIGHLEDVVLFCPQEIEPRRRLAMLYVEHGDRASAVTTAGPLLEQYRQQGLAEEERSLLAALPELEAGAPAVMAGPGSLADEEGAGDTSVIEEAEPVRFADEDSDLIEIVDIESDAAADVGVAETADSGETAVAATDEAAVAWSAEIEEPAAEPAVFEATAADAPVEEPLVEEQEVADQLVEISDSFVGPSMGDLEQLDFFIEQELYEDAVRVLAQLEEEHPDDEEVVRRRLRLKDIGVLLEQVESVGEGAEELFADEEQYIDLAKELEAELAAEEAMVDEATGRGKGEAILEEVFREFQKGVAEQLSEEDSDTHFNLGIAYREMGLLPEVIREFQVASRDKQLFVESCSIIGLCYQEQGMWSEAASWYQKALVAPDITEEARLGLRYDLAVAYEAAGDGEQALGIFAEILAADPGYRDVSNRASSLAEQRQAN